MSTTKNSKSARPKEFPKFKFKTPFRSFISLVLAPDFAAKARVKEFKIGPVTNPWDKLYGHLTLQIPDGPTFDLVLEEVEAHSLRFRIK